MDCSHAQFARVWMELEDALRSENGYGGMDAEIYLYVVQPRSPTIDNQKTLPKAGDMFFPEFVNRENEAIHTIYEICKLFANLRDATIHWEGKHGFCELFWHPDDDGWIYNLGHRVHVRVNPINREK